MSESIDTLARRHGLAITGDITTNEMGLDFSVAFALATFEGEERSWVLRIPRRPDAMARATYERRALDFLKPRLPVAIPDWRVFADDLIAYPLLPGQPALTFDATYAVTWHMDQGSPSYVEHLGRLIAALHAISPADARAAGLDEVIDLRADFAGKLDRVRRELGIGAALDRRLSTWFDDTSWPDFVTVTHGDLYAGHVLVEPDGRPTAVIDWTEARLGDPSIDFTGHATVFGPESLERLIAAYENAGGRTWPRMTAHITERAAAAPVLYGLFALLTQSPDHIAAAKAQLNAA